MAFTVTATQGGTTHNGIALDVLVLTGAAATQNGVTNSALISAAVFALAITPGTTGSRVYGSAVHGTATATANGSTTIIGNTNDATNAARYLQWEASATSTANVAETIGDTETASGIIALAEILGATSEDGSAPGVASSTAATTVTTASFTPPAGAMLLALVTSPQAAGGVTTMALSDTSGLGLTWTELRKQNASGQGYVGVWVAQLPSAGTPMAQQSSLQNRARRFRLPAQQPVPPPPAGVIPGTDTLAGAGSITGPAVILDAGSLTTLAGAGSVGTPDAILDAGSLTTLGGAGSISGIPAQGGTLGGQGSITGPDVIQGAVTTLAGAGSVLAIPGRNSALPGAGSLNAPGVVLGAVTTLAGTGTINASSHGGPLHIILLGGPAKIVSGPLRVPVAAPAMALAGFAGTVGTFTLRLPKPAFDPGGHIAHNPLNLKIPLPRMSLTGKVLHSAVVIVIPAPKMAMAGTRWHAGPFNLVFGRSHGLAGPEMRKPEVPDKPGGRPRIIVTVT